MIMIIIVMITAAAAGDVFLQPICFDSAFNMMIAFQNGSCLRQPLHQMITRRKKLEINVQGSSTTAGTLLTKGRSFCTRG